MAWVVWVVSSEQWEVNGEHWQSALAVSTRSVGVYGVVGAHNYANKYG